VIKRSSAPTILTTGLVLACVAVLVACIQVTVLDQSAVESSAGKMLRTQQVEASMRPRAAVVLAAVVPAGITLGTQPGDNPDAAVDRMLHDPAFTQAFAGALGSVSSHVTQGESGPIVLDPALVRAAAVSTVTALDPAAAGLPSTDTAATVAIDTTSIPDLRGATSALRIAGSVAGILGLILIFAGILLSDRRIRAVGRLGRWIAGTGLVVLVLFWLLPEFVMPVVRGWTQVAGVVMSSGGALLVPGLVLAAVGVAISFGAKRLVALGREHTLAVVPKAPMRRATAGDKRWRDSA
jgi:hypothetical protein